jgi:succinate dehydrogenase/fumarate reductase-like Fe-S protein
MSKEEKLDKLLELEHHLTLMFDSDVSVAMTLLEEIRNIKQKEETPLCTPDNCRHGH